MNQITQTEKYADNLFEAYNLAKRRNDKVRINITKSNIKVFQRTTELWRNYEAYQLGLCQSEERRSDVDRLSKLLERGVE